MASPYYTKQPVYLEDPSGRYENILNKNQQRTGYADSTSARLNFPFTPTISIISSSNYSEYGLTHSNFQQRAFDSHANMELNITAPMIVRSEEEADYVYNAALWIRGMMKMQWLRDNDPGMPPPILRFNAHGIYKNVPCVISDFTWNLDSDIDYVETNSGMRVPVSNMFVLSLSTTYSPKSIRENFSVKDYLAGNLKDKGYV